MILAGTIVSLKRKKTILAVISNTASFGYLAAVLL
jgi:hypothetical protein